MIFEVRNKRADGANVIILSGMGIAFLICSAIQNDYIGMIVSLLIVAFAFHSKRLSSDEDNFIMTQKLLGFSSEKLYPFSQINYIIVEKTEKENVELKFLSNGVRFRGDFLKADAEKIVKLIKVKSHNVRIVEAPQRRKFRLIKR